MNYNIDSFSQDFQPEIDAEPTATNELEPTSVPENATEQSASEQDASSDSEQPVGALLVSFERQIDKRFESPEDAQAICDKIVKLDLPNAQVGKEYCARILDPSLAFRGEVYSEGFDQLGLNVTQVLPNGECRIEGTPTRAFEGKVRVSVTLNFELSYSKNGLWRNDKTNQTCESEVQFIVNPNPWDLWDKNEPNDPLYQKPHSDSFSRVLPTEPPLTLLAARLRGRSHAHEGKYCDDHFVVDEAKTPDDWTIVAVADGAGSAKFSRKGSELACDVAVKTLRQFLETKAENNEDLLFDTRLKKAWEISCAQTNIQENESQTPDALSVNNVSEDAEEIVPLNDPPTVETDEKVSEDTKSNEEYYAEETDSTLDDNFNSSVDEGLESLKQTSDEISGASEVETSSATMDESISQTSEQEQELNKAESAKPCPSADPLVSTQLSIALHTAVRDAWIALKNEAEKQTAESSERVRINDFNTTLLLAGLKKLPATESAPAAWVVLSYWVGDGAMAVYRPDGKDEVMTLGTPDGGEFAGQTRFLTMRDEIDDKKIAARSRLVFLQDFDKIALMTDGVSDPFFPAERDFKSYERWQEFWKNDMPEHFSGVMGTSATIKEREEKLLKGLTFKIAGNHDDRTLVLILNEKGEQKDEEGAED